MTDTQPDPMFPTPRRPPISPVRRFFGRALWAVGILWMTLSGACTLLFLVTSATDRSVLTGMLPIVLICGAIGIAPGLAAFFAGRALLRP